MATPNYGFEKRQRELAKKNKKAEKMRERAERKAHVEDVVDAHCHSESAQPSELSNAARPQIPDQ